MGLMTSPARKALERRSAHAVAYLHQLPRWLPFALALALLLVGLFVAGPVGAVALGLLALFQGWLLALSWPRHDQSRRALGLITLAVLVAAAVVQGLR
jgi:hypothetical protein